ncbi:hypothetical protein [Rubritalea profundi]|uniref:hypothetical protein n=1 Tax=Rubritalea profundi TaxID=1658618 RepID=UPI00101AEA98|nr:hypothetical protein [Rubritalea profundi]
MASTQSFLYWQIAAEGDTCRSASVIVKLHQFAAPRAQVLDFPSTCNPVITAYVFWTKEAKLY